MLEKYSASFQHGRQRSLGPAPRQVRSCWAWLGPVTAVAFGCSERGCRTHWSPPHQKKKKREKLSDVSSRRGHRSWGDRLLKGRRWIRSRGKDPSQPSPHRGTGGPPGGAHQPGGTPRRGDTLQGTAVPRGSPVQTRPLPLPGMPFLLEEAQVSCLIIF